MILYYHQTEVPALVLIRSNQNTEWCEYFQYRYLDIQSHHRLSYLPRDTVVRCYNARCNMMVRSLLIKGCDLGSLPSLRDKSQVNL